jgi:hypothetical protein
MYLNFCACRTVKAYLSLTRCSRIRFGRPKFTQLVRALPASYAASELTVVLTRSRHLFPFWARWIQPTPSQPIYLRYIGIFQLRLDESCLFASHFPTKMLYALHRVQWLKTEFPDKWWTINFREQEGVDDPSEDGKPNFRSRKRPFGA